MNSIDTFTDLVSHSDNIVFFGGAGVSTESGIPDFRSVDGLYNQTYQYPPETILSHSFYQNNPEEFYRFYRDKMLCLDAKPNMAHIKLAALEKAGKLKAVVTQNIDGPAPKGRQQKCLGTAWQRPSQLLPALPSFF
jgi:NAD-dependent deacetylase